MSNKVGLKDQDLNGGFKTHYKSYYNPDGSYTIQRKNVSIILVPSIKQDKLFVKLDDTDYEVNTLDIITYSLPRWIIQKFEESISKKLSAWARNKMYRSLEFHCIKFIYNELSKINSDIPKLIKAYRSTHNRNCNFWEYFAPILKNQYLISDYCKFPFYRAIYYKYHKKDGIIDQNNWLNLLIEKYKCPILKKLLFKRYWNYDTVEYISKLHRFKRIPQTKKEFICYSIICASTENFRAWPTHKEINKYWPLVKSIRKSSYIIGSFLHLYHSFEYLQNSLNNSIKNWSWQRLCEKATEYHANLIHNQSKIQSLYDNNTHWPLKIKIMLPVNSKITVTPLLTAKELREESKTMKHCVGGDNYIRQCLDGHTRIFHIEQGKNKATLEIKLPDIMNIYPLSYYEESAWQLVQIKGPCNQENNFTVKIRKMFEEKEIKIVEQIDGPDLIINKKEKSLCMNHC